MAPPFAQKPSRFSQMRADASRARTSKADIARDLDIARGRKEFFSNRPDVSDDRALRRMKQADETQRFKNLFTKPVAGSSNLLQMTADAPRSLAQERMRLANQYGPTFREIGSDIAAGIGSMARGIREKGTPLMQLGKGLLGGIQNFFSNTFNPGNIGGLLQAAGPQAQQQYSMLMQQPGMTYQRAFEMATGTPFTNPQGQTSNVISDFFAPKIGSAMRAVDDFIQSGQNFNTLLMGLRPDQRRVYDLEIMKPGMTREQAFQTAIRVKQMAMGGVASL